MSFCRLSIGLLKLAFDDADREAAQVEVNLDILNCFGV